MSISPEVKSVVIRAYPAPGHDHFYRAGRKWGREPVAMAVVEEVKDRTREISRADLALLAAPTSQRHLSVVPAGSGSEADVRVTAAIALKDQEIAGLRAEIASLQEERTALRAEHDAAMLRANNRIAELTQEIEGLRSRAAEKRAKA